MLEFDTDISLHEEAGLRITLRRDASEQFVRRIEQTDFGSEGLRYRRLGVPEQIARLARPGFVELRLDDDLVGTYALSATRLRIGDRSAVGVYRGLLTVHPDARGRGLGRQLVERTLEWMSAEARRIVVGLHRIVQQPLARAPRIARCNADRFSRLAAGLPAMASTAGHRRGTALG